MKKFTVSLVQITSQNNWEKNLERIGDLIHQELLKYPNRPRLVCLPENFSFFGEEKEKLKYLSTITEATRKFLRDTSVKEKIYLLGGGYPYPSGNQKYFNQASLYSPQGDEIFFYRKLHLFDTNPGDGVQYRESLSTERGKDLPKVVDLGFCQFTSFICYDLRFPEVFRKVVRQGAEVIALPAAFTVPTGKAHWEVLLRARAIENFCYILAPAQVGTNIYNSKKNKIRVTYGHSMVVNPWGEIVASLDGENEGIISVCLEPKILEESRNKIPALQHRVFVD